MRNFRWWLGQKLFHLSYTVMPAAERAAMLQLIKLGTEALRNVLEAQKGTQP